MPARKKSARTSNVTPIRRGKKRCPQCGLTGKHQPSCKNAFRPSQPPLVIDGRTGKPIDATVDGKPAKIDTRQAPTTQQTLIEVPLEQLVHDYNKLAGERDEAASKRGYYGGVVKNLNERIDPILAEMRRRDDEKRGVAPPPLPFAGDADRDEEDDDE